MAEPRARELALLGLLALLWGSSYLFVEIGLRGGLPPVTLIALRVAIACAFLLAVLAMQGGRLPRDGRTWGRLAVQSVLNASGAWLLLAWGQQHVESAVAAVLNSTSPLFVTLLALLFVPSERASPARAAGVALGFGGVLLIVGGEAWGGFGVSVLGQLAALASAMLYAGGALHGRRLAHLTPTATAAGTMLCALAVVAPLSLALDAPFSLSPSWDALGAAAALGLLSTGIALILYFRLVRTLGPLGVASQAYLRAGIGVALGIVLLGERPEPPVFLGLAAALLGVWLINRR